MTEDIEIFANYCVFTRSIYLHARELFETSSAEDKALMGNTAGMFFGDLNRVLNEYVILASMQDHRSAARHSQKRQSHDRFSTRALRLLK